MQKIGIYRIIGILLPLLRTLAVMLSTGFTEDCKYIIYKGHRSGIIKAPLIFNKTTINTYLKYPSHFSFSV